MDDVEEMSDSSSWNGSHGRLELAIHTVGGSWLSHEGERNFLVLIVYDKTMFFS